MYWQSVPVRNSGDRHDIDVEHRVGVPLRIAIAIKVGLHLDVNLGQRHGSDMHAARY
jgi:hypothetical protein